MDLHSNPVVAAGLNLLKDERCDGEPGFDLAMAGFTDGRYFNIRKADSYVSRQLANKLLERRYGWRGYSIASLPDDPTANRITLTATDSRVTIGTITVGLDGAEGINCEDVFEDEIAEMRGRGLRLCEFTKLAVDPVCGNKRVLAALFHVAYIVAHCIRRYDMLLMEVNPRHVRYYERMLGAQVVGEERINHSVNAPSVLLALHFSHITEQIAQIAGRPELASTERTLYPFAFTAQEQEGIISRLMGAQQPVSRSMN